MSSNISVIKQCPYCRGNRIGCDYCDESGLMDLNEIGRARYYENNRRDEDDGD